MPTSPMEGQQRKKGEGAPLLATHSLHLLKHSQRESIAQFRSTLRCMKKRLSDYKTHVRSWRKCRRDGMEFTTVSPTHFFSPRQSACSITSSCLRNRLKVPHYTKIYKVILHSSCAFSLFRNFFLHILDFFFF